MRTKLMGILNVTPNSFFTGEIDPSKAIETGIKMFHEGADIIDIGGESSKPGATPISLEEELRRVIPVVKALSLNGMLSIDSIKPEVADQACQAGAKLINDISGFRNPDMIAVAQKYQVPVCVMHMQGDPKTMQLKPYYEKGVIPTILHFFEDKIDTLLKGGISQENIILDPGIGFGKTIADNWEILHNLGEFQKLGFPILIGLSRKSFMSKILNKPPQELLPATLAMNALVIRSHVDFIRVHDVREHRDIIDLIYYEDR